jgi:ribonuclease HII
MQRRLTLFEFEHPLTGWRYAGIFSIPAHFESYITLFCKFRQGRDGLMFELILISFTAERKQCSRRWCCADKQQAADYRGSKQRFLDFPNAPHSSRTLFNRTHIKSIRRSANIFDTLPLEKVWIEFGTIEAMQTEWLLGVDEAGRGPLAGPVALGVVAVPLGFDIRREFKGVTDSKLLNPQKREIIFTEAERRARRGDLRFVVKFADHRHIDTHGIARSVETLVHSGVRELAGPSHSFVMLDGLLRAPARYPQRTIIGGDLRVPLVSLASVLAKVVRDRTMEQLAVHYPGYGFEANKGYGTRAHLLALKRRGLCDIHRRTYCRALVKGSVRT